MCHPYFSKGYQQNKETFTLFEKLGGRFNGEWLIQKSEVSDQNPWWLKDFQNAASNSMLTIPSSSVPLNIVDKDIQQDWWYECGCLKESIPDTAFVESEH